MGCAVHSMLERETGFTSVELKINFVRPIFDKTGPLRAAGKVIHFGRQIATAEGKLTDEAASCMRMGQRLV